MPARLANGRKRYAVDLWPTENHETDPDVTLYSDDKPALIAKAQAMMLLMFREGGALLYERTEETPDWDAVESKYWSKPEPVPRFWNG